MTGRESDDGHPGKALKERGYRPEKHGHRLPKQPVPMSYSEFANQAPEEGLEPPTR